MNDRIGRAIAPVKRMIGAIDEGPSAGVPAHGATPRGTPLMPELRGPIRAGVLVIGLFFGGVGWWAATAPLAGAAIAPGVVSPDGSRRTVQHLEGGIIREIRVRDGSSVKAGDPLIVLEDVQSRASVDVLQAGQLVRLLLPLGETHVGEQQEHQQQEQQSQFAHEASLPEPSAASYPQGHARKQGD